MGLIDKNEILHELRIGKSCEECKRYAEYGDPKSKCKGHLNWVCRKIQNMKSVEAIPIEWLRENALDLLDFGQGVETLIKKWESQK